MKLSKHPGDPRLAKAYFDARLAFTVVPGDVEPLRERVGQLQVVDVRPAAAFARGHVPGAIHLAEEHWAAAAACDRELLHVVYSAGPACHAAARACAALARQGVAVMELSGGFSAWQDAGLPVAEAAWRTALEEPVRTDGMRQLQQATVNFMPAE